VPAIFTEADLLPISALQHLIYCPRQCALIHNEQQWEENRLTVEGQQMHENAHDGRKSESRPGLRITRGLALRSFTYGITGQADVVEFRDSDTGVDPEEGGDFTPPVLPVEYKRGQPKAHDADAVQLCAQALCLEEMLSLTNPIASGRLFYGKTRRRQEVPFDDALRRRTRDTAAALHELIGSGRTPTARYEKTKCDRCSLIRLCMPRQLSASRTATERFNAALNASLDEAPA